MDLAFSVHVFFGLISLTNFQLIDGSEYCTQIKDERICYSLGSTSTLSWTEAYRKCRNINATLPIIRNTEEKTNLDNYFEYLRGKRDNVNSAWLSGRWIGFQHWTWVNGRQLQGNLIIDGGSSQTEEERKPHGTVVYNLSFIPARPDFDYRYLCQNGGQCRDLVGIQLTNSCLIHYEQHYSWYVARSDCIVKGGDLAVLNNQDINILRNTNEWQDKYSLNWIGLSKGSWFWIKTPTNSRVSGYEEGQVEREELKYYNWPKGDNTFGKDQCISFTRSADLWKMLLCNEKQSVICERRVYSNGNSSTATSDIFTTTGRNAYTAHSKDSSSTATSATIMPTGTNAYTVYSNDSSSTLTSVTIMPTGTNVFVLGLTLVGVLLFIAIGVIVGLVIRGKTNASKMEPPSDGQYQNTTRTHDINIDRELSGYYDEIELENSGYQSLRTSQINTYIDIIG